jgi:hypothetical protein
LALTLACGGKSGHSNASQGGATGDGGGAGGSTHCVELREPDAPAFVDVPEGGPSLVLLKGQSLAGPDERHLRAVWARSENEVYAVGHGVLRFDGCTFSSLRDDGDYAAIWGTEDDVWVGGTQERGCDPCNGEVLHFDGTTWRELPAVPPVVSIWASAPDDVWIGVLQSSTTPDLLPSPAVFRWNGAAWKRVSLPASPGSAAYSVLGSDEDEVYVGGNGLSRWDGAAFVATDIVSRCGPGSGVAGRSLWFGDCRIEWGDAVVTEFAGRWGASAEDVWSVGEGGRVLRWNGTASIAVDSGTAQDLTGVYGVSASDVWVVGDAGTIVHFAP